MKKVETPLQLAKGSNLTTLEAEFCIKIVLLGYSQVEAYLTSFSTNANGNSASALANRKLKEPKIDAFCRYIGGYYSEFELLVNIKYRKSYSFTDK